MKKNCYENPLTFIVAMVFLMDDAVAVAELETEVVMVQKYYCHDFYFVLVCVFTWNDVTQQGGVVLQLNSYVPYLCVEKTAPVSVCSLGKTHLLKSRVFDTLYGSKNER